MLTIIVSCMNPNTEKRIHIKKGTKLKELIAIEKIDSVEMINNSGKHLIESEKLASFVAKLGESSYQDASLKMGAIGFSIYMEGNSIPFTGRTHGDYIETHSSHFSIKKEATVHDWIYFKVTDLNLDNY